MPNDALRSAHLAALDVTGYSHDLELERQAEIAALLAAAPIALTCLVDGSKQWLKASVGLLPRQQPPVRDLCVFAIAQGSPVVVSNATLDPRFERSPLVGAPLNLRFAAAFPFAMDGVYLGALCIFDSVPRVLPEATRRGLDQIAQQIGSIFERRWRGNLLAELESMVHRTDRQPLGARVDTSWIDSALALANEILGTACAVVSRVEDTAYSVLHVAAPPDGPVAGQQFELSETACVGVMATDNVITVAVRGDGALSLPSHLGQEFAAYIGVSLWVDGRRFGSLNFSHPDPRGRPWSVEEKGIVALLGRRFSHALETTTRLETQGLFIRVVAEQTPGGLAFFDGDGHLRFANRAFAASREFARPGAAGESIFDGPANSSGFADALAGHANQVLDVDRLQRDGRRLDVETLFTPARDTNGEVIGVIALELDATHHRRAREGLRNVRQMMDSLDQVGKAVCYYDADHKLALWNRAHAEFLAEVPSALTPGADYRSFVDGWARVHNTAQTDGPSVERLVREHEAFHTDPAGVLERRAPGHRVFQIYELKLPDGGTVVTSEEVTELRNKERELLRTNADLRQLAYVASHDLKEPLRMMSAYLKLLRARFAPHLDETGERHLGYVLEGSDRMRDLIDSLMSFTALDRTAKTIDMVPLDNVVAAAVANLDLRIAETGAHVGWGELPTIAGDRNQLVLLFQNVIDNALKFCRPDSAPHVTIGGRPFGRHRWEVSIADRGIGVSATFAGKAFDVFARGQSRDNFPGTGIGLAIARKVVENHGGRIRFDATYLAGARLVILFDRGP